MIITFDISRDVFTFENTSHFIEFTDEKKFEYNNDFKEHLQKEISKIVEASNLWD